MSALPPSLDIGSHYSNYVGWINQERAMTVKFEDLIGSRGGGDDGLQMDRVKEVSQFLGLELPAEKIREICADLFSTSAKTFRKGQVGSWREHFESEHVSAFNEVGGGVIQAFGYEDH